MRSTFFDRPLEYQLLTAKEEWLQGEPIEGKLSIRNMNPEKVIANTVDVLLACGNFRKIKAGEENCWEVTSRKYSAGSESDGKSAIVVRLAV